MVSWPTCCGKWLRMPRGVYIRTAEMKAHIAAGARADAKIHPRKQNRGNRGRNLSEEHKQKISASLMGHPVSVEAREKLRDTHSGEKCSLWKGGISFEPYCPKFNQDLRRRIRAFFEYQCVACGKDQSEETRQLSCHHVEYNKLACCDGQPVTFAALCQKHHCQTNGDRDRWEAMLHRVIDEIWDGRSYYTKEEMMKVN